MGFWNDLEEKVKGRKLGIVEKFEREKEREREREREGVIFKALECAPCGGAPRGETMQLRDTP